MATFYRFNTQPGTHRKSNDWRMVREKLPARKSQIKICRMCVHMGANRQGKAPGSQKDLKQPLGFKCTIIWYINYPFDLTGPTLMTIMGIWGKCSPGVSAFHCCLNGLLCSVIKMCVFAADKIWKIESQWGEVVCCGCTPWVCISIFKDDISDSQSSICFWPKSACVRVFGAGYWGR